MKKEERCPYYQGVCGLDESYVCYASHDPKCSIRITKENQDHVYKTWNRMIGEMINEDETTDEEAKKLKQIIIKGETYGKF